MILTPQQNSIIVRRNKPKDRTSSGILLSNPDTKATEWGEVIAAGKEVKLYKKGMNVVFNTFDRDELTLEGCEDLVIINEDKILATFK